ncbi:MAG TPA: EAL domain-containing protein [Patescibacteria group bacterium]|nr:EAL domain-containing protein [Patescibacteria group bacterium]
MSELLSEAAPPKLDSGSRSGLDAIAGWADEGRRLSRWIRLLPFVNAIAVAAIAVVVVYRFWLAEDSAGEAAAWAVSLVGLAVLGYVTQRILGRRLALNSRRQASLLEAVSDIGEGLLIIEGDRYVAANAAYHAMTGYTPAELSAMKSLIELAVPEQRSRFKESLSARLAGSQTAVRYDSALLTKDGRRLDIDTAVRALPEGKNRAIVLVHDVTERRRAEDSKRDTEARFRTLFEQAQAGMAFAALDGIITTANPAFGQIVGFTERELQNRSLFDLTMKEHRVALEEKMNRLVGGDHRDLRIETRFMKKSGDPVWVDLTARCAHDADGKPLYFQTVAINIEDHKRSEVLQEARFAVTQALVTSPGWGYASSSVLEGLCTTLDWDLAEYWEVSPARDTMHFVTSWKRPESDTFAFESTALHVTYHRGSGLAGKVWETGAPFSMPELALDGTERAAAALAAGLHGVVGFPVRSGRRVIGMIALYDPEPRELDEGLIAVMNDIGSQIGEFVERKRAEVALQESEKRMRAVLDNVADGLATIDHKGVIESANPAVVRLFGYTEEELIGQHAGVLIATTARSAFDNYVQRRLRVDLPVTGMHETMGKRKNGSLFPLEFVVNSMQLGSRHLFIATLRDISERKAHTDALEYQALHDALTGLPNRSLFGDRLRQALLAARRNQKMLGVLLLDLDRFKDINDALGHDRGDSLLQEVTGRLRGVLRATDTIARLGGDEFAMLALDAKQPEDVVAAARKLLAALEGPFTIADQMVETGASIGIAIYPMHGDDPSTLLRRADVAMYVAKRSGGGHAVYAPEQEAQTLRRSSLAGELRRSIPQSELVLHYQPQVTLATGAIKSVEALLRWNHPRDGLMPPDRFIPMAEETGIIHPLTAWVMDTALAQLCKWLDRGLDLGVSVNVSSRNLEDRSLEDMVSKSLAKYKVDPRRVTLEISESDAMAAAAAKALVRLHEIGVRLCLDDFGTGYSSLLYLTHLPVDEIKIDKSFILALASDHDSQAIVRSAIGLGHNLELTVVAEGLQDRSAEAILVEAGCDVVQGFLLGRPMPEDEITEMLEASLAKKVG